MWCTPGGCGWRFLSTSAASFTARALIAGLLEYLALDGGGGRIVHVHPAPGQRPAAVAAFAHQQHALALRTPRRARRPWASHSRARPATSRGRQPAAPRARVCSTLRDQFLQLLVALAVERVLGEREAVLRDGLHLARPLEQRCLVRARRHRIARARFAAARVGARPGARADDELQARPGVIDCAHLDVDQGQGQRELRE